MTAHWKLEVCFSIFGVSPVNSLLSAVPSISTDTYRQYQKAKNNVHGNKDVANRNVEVKPDIGSGPKKVYIAQTMWHSFSDSNIKNLISVL